MRVFAGSLQTETNTFSPLSTGDAAFREMRYAAGSHPETPTLYTYPLWRARQVCKERGWKLTEGLCAGAHPGGIISASVWTALRNELLSDLRKSIPADIVVLGLHGAMMAENSVDCEGELLSLIRAEIGPNAFLGATIDPHCHLSEEMLLAADILIPFKEYPHTDANARAEDLWNAALGWSERKIKPVMKTVDCKMIAMFFTPDEPCAGLIRLQHKIEEQPDVLSAGIIHGFPWGDSPDFGTKVLVSTNNDPVLAQSCAEQLATAVFDLRGRTMTPLISVKDAVSLAKQERDMPLVLADFADNPGAGCPGDSTFLIGELIRADVKNAAAAFIYDPVAVSLAKAAGVGTRIKLRVGGKTSKFSGAPLDLEVEVRQITENFIYNIIVLQIPLGDVVVVRTKQDFDLVLTSLRSQCFTPSAYSEFGIDVEKKGTIVVKSMQHFTAGFAEMKKEIAYVDSPGAASLDLKALPYKNIDRSIWPFNE